MIELHPVPEAEFKCPDCSCELSVEGWYMPGSLTLAELFCSNCSTEYYGDLPVGFGNTYPMLVEKKTGHVHNPGYGGTESGVEWYENRFKKYSTPNTSTVDISVTRNSPVESPLILNTVDSAYGHSLLKLLNASRHLDTDDSDLIVIVQPMLEWMVPDGVAEVWTVDIPLSDGDDWFPQFHDRVAELLSGYEKIHIARTFSIPHPAHFDIEDFTGIAPFPLSEWANRLDQPSVTFIWRDDRVWAPDISENPRQIRGYLDFGLKVANHFADTNLNESHFRVKVQNRRITKLAERLRCQIPNLEFTVAGIGPSGGFPSWITDLRTESPDEEFERRLAKQYAQSHLVLGIHGSNMLLPSALAGGVIEIVPQYKYEAFLSDMLPRESSWSGRGQFGTLFRYQFTPAGTPARTVAKMASVMLNKYPGRRVLMGERWTNPNSDVGLYEPRDEMLNLQDMYEQRSETGRK